MFGLRIQFSGEATAVHSELQDMKVFIKEKMMETNRIILRPWRDSDAEVLYKWASDPDVGPRAGWAPHQSVEESLEIIRTVFNDPCTHGLSS